MTWFDMPSVDYSRVPAERAVEIEEQLRALSETDDLAERWREVSKTVLKPSDAFEIHSALFHENYRNRDAAEGPPPGVLPSGEIIAASNLGVWLEALGFESYSQFHDFSVKKREEFLRAALERLHIRFRQNFDQLLDLSEGVERPYWFKGATMNIVDSVFGVGNAEDAQRIAVVFQREGGQLERWTFRKLQTLSGRIGNGLKDMGLEPGDAVAIDMPMTPDCVAIYLGIIRAGLSVVSIADSFASEEIATRLRISGAKAIFSQDVIVRGGKKLPLYEKVTEANAPLAIVVSAESSLQVELRERDKSFADFLSDRDEFETVACDPRDTINILFSSGTTGDPKAIPWNHTTPVRCALDGFVHQDIRPGDVVAWPTNIGWMMGPWLIFASLINRGVIALYGGMPQTREFCEFVQNARVNVLGVVPSLVKAWKTGRHVEGLDWSAIRAFSSTGESSNPEDMLFLMSRAGYKPIIEYCGGTEIGGAYVSSTVIQPNSPSCFSAKVVGLDFNILDENGREAEVGELYVVGPAVGLSIDLLNKDHHDVYFKGCPSGKDNAILRRHGDEVQALPGGYFRALGRADDTMNLGGIKVSSVELERTMDRVDGVVETAAIAVSPDEGGPSQLVVYAVTESGAWNDETELRSKLQNEIRQGLNPLFKISSVVITDALPRTASNKVMRRVLRAEYQRKLGPDA